MAIVEEKTIQSKDGIKKTIDHKSMGVALDILQRGLYSFPIKSTVRELASNAHDAVKERDVAKAILEGKERIEDHYDVTKVDGIYHSSGWDPDYFNLDWLSEDPHSYIYYEEKELKDVLRIVDNGVGLGKDRLLGYFTINYSSKRTNKDTLGRFGLGSKVALSLGVESFRVINRYNGKLFRFDVYLDKIDSVVSKFGNKGINKYESLTVEDPETHETFEYKAYYEETDKPNGVEVQVEIKKHNKKAMLEAIESQMMYVPNIKVLLKDKGAISYTPMDIRAHIEYQDDDIIISRTRVYDKPHILLGTQEAYINYGFVQFEELELEPKRGAVGLILDINDIEVTPSREAPIWSAKTRKAVLEKYQKVTETATKFVNQALRTETDYVKWMAMASNTVSNVMHSGDNSALSSLASIIDVSEIKDLTFSPNPRIKLEKDVKKMFGEHILPRVIKWDRYKSKVDRKPMASLTHLRKPIYYTFVNPNKYKDRYIYEEEGEFVLINFKEGYETFGRKDMILDSPLLKEYEALDVPLDRLEIYMAENDDSSDDDEDLKAITTAASRATMRKQNEQIVVQAAYFKSYSYEWQFNAKDYKISDLYGLTDGHSIMYGTGNERNFMKSILYMLPSYCTVPKGYANDYFQELDLTKFNTILVARENVKYVTSSDKFVHCSRMVVDKYDKRKGHIEFSKELKYGMTLFAVYKYIQDRFKSHKHFGSDDVMESLNHGFSLRGMFDEKSPAYRFVSNALRDFKQKYDSFKSNTDDFNFFNMLMQLNLMRMGFIEYEDEALESLLEQINDEIPEALCELVDTVNSAEVILEDMFKEIVDLIEHIAKNWGIFAAFTNRYYRGDSYVSAVTDYYKTIFQFTRTKEYDAFVQQ